MLANDYQVGIYSKITTAINPYITITITEQKLTKLTKKTRQKIVEKQKKLISKRKKIGPNIGI